MSQSVKSSSRPATPLSVSRPSTPKNMSSPRVMIERLPDSTPERTTSPSSSGKKVAFSPIVDTKPATPSPSMLDHPDLRFLAAVDPMVAESLTSYEQHRSLEKQERAISEIPVVESDLPPMGPTGRRSRSRSKTPVVAAEWVTNPADWVVEDPKVIRSKSRSSSRGK